MPLIFRPVEQFYIADELIILHFDNSYANIPVQQTINDRITMAKELSNILKPGMGVDLIFNLSSMSPIVKPSIIFDRNDQEIVVAQPKNRISSDYNYQTMHISSLIPDTVSGKNRKGYSCKILKLIDAYRLANNNTTRAILVKYEEPFIDMNIRAAFRFEPTATHSVMGKIIFKGEEFYSGTHFKVFNISVSGLGLLIPRKINKLRNPLLEIPKGSDLKIGLLLRSTEAEEEITTLESKIHTVRQNTNYNKINGFAGFSFHNLSQQNEEALNKFIHNAQLFEIRQSNRL